MRDKKIKGLKIRKNGEELGGRNKGRNILKMRLLRDSKKVSEKKKRIDEREVKDKIRIKEDWWGEMRIKEKMKEKMEDIVGDVLGMDMGEKKEMIEELMMVCEIERRKNEIEMRGMKLREIGKIEIKSKKEIKKGLMIGKRRLKVNEENKRMVK